MVSYYALMKENEADLDPFLLFTIDSYLLRSRKPFSRTHSGTVAFCNTSLTLTLSGPTHSATGGYTRSLRKRRDRQKKQTLLLSFRHGYQTRIAFCLKRGEQLNHLGICSQTTQSSCFSIISFQRLSFLVCFSLHRAKPKDEESKEVRIS